MKSTKRISSALWASAALAACLVAPTAQAQNLKPGQYEYSTVTEVFGMKIPVNFKQCVTQKDVDTNSAYANQQGSEGCTPPVVKRKGSNITISYACSKPKMRGEGSGMVTDESFTMNMRVTQFDEGSDMEGNVVQTALSAKRLGDCAQ
ncbi:MAG: DUF3617 family protein [Rhodoferax sp.]